MLLNRRGDERGGNAGPRFAGMNAVCGVKRFNVRQFVKRPADLGDEGVLLLSCSAIKPPRSSGHFRIIPAFGRQFGTAFPVSPGRVEKGNCPVAPDLTAQLLYAGKEFFRGKSGGPWLIS